MARDLGGATCLTRPRSFDVFVCRVNDHHKLIHYLPRLKKTCGRQVVLDKWFSMSDITIAS